MEFETEVVGRSEGGQIRWYDQLLDIENSFFRIEGFHCNKTQKDYLIEDLKGLEILVESKPMDIEELGRRLPLQRGRIPNNSRAPTIYELELIQFVDQTYYTPPIEWKVEIGAEIFHGMSFIITERYPVKYTELRH